MSLVAAILSGVAAAAGRCVTEGSTLFLWTSILGSWCQAKPSAEAFRKRGVVPATRSAAAALAIPEECVSPCLHVADGYPVRYGVVVAS